MNRGELLEKLKAGESLREVDLTEADPLYADFEGVDLTGSDLSRTEIPAGVTGKAWPHGFADSYRAPRWRARFSGATLDRAGELLSSPSARRRLSASVTQARSES